MQKDLMFPMNRILSSRAIAHPTMLDHLYKTKNTTIYRVEKQRQNNPANITQLHTALLHSSTAPLPSHPKVIPSEIPSPCTPFPSQNKNARYQLKPRKTPDLRSPTNTDRAKSSIPDKGLYCGEFGEKESVSICRDKPSKKTKPEELAPSTAGERAGPQPHENADG